MNGFIIWRREMETVFPWYRTPNTAWLFFHLVTKANVRDSFFAGRKVSRGSVVTSLDNLVEETGLTKSEVRTALKHLTSTDTIEVETSNRFTVVKINNFEMFSESHTSDTQMTRESHTDYTPVAHESHHNEKEKKEEKEEKEKNKENTSSSESGSRASEAVKAVVVAWNDRCGSALKISRISPASTRYRSLVARIDEYGMADVLQAVNNVAASSFLREATWFSFDWFVKPNNFVKVLDGNYSDRRGTAETPAVESAEEEKPLSAAERLAITEAYTKRMLEGD